MKILHDNIPTHKSKLLQECLTQENVETLPHTAYSLALAPRDSFLVLNMKKCLNGRMLMYLLSPWNCHFPLSTTFPPKQFQRNIFAVDRMTKKKKCVVAQEKYFEQLN